jgi:hypothetical protein
MIPVFSFLLQGTLYYKVLLQLGGVWPSWHGRQHVIGKHYPVWNTAENKTLQEGIMDAAGNRVILPP